MVNVLGWILTITVWGWVVAEVVLQVRQYRMGGKAKLNEWASLGVIIGSIVVGNILAGLIDRNVSFGHVSVNHLVMLAISLPIVWAGIAFRLWSIVTLGRFFRGVVHVQEDHYVVQAGPYRVLRHPSYAGALVAVLGLALTFHNVFGFIVFIGCVLIGMCYRIVVEERVLTDQLDGYAEYRERTSRLIPRVW